MLYDHGSRHRSVQVPCRVFKQEEFLRPERDRLTRSRNSPPQEIKFQITTTEEICLTGTTPDWTPPGAVESTG